MNWFDLIVSSSVFSFLIAFIFNNMVYYNIYSAQSYANNFANKMFYKYCLYKFLDQNSFEWQKVYNSLYANKFKINCENQTFYIKYQITKVPTGKSEVCDNCIYFKVEGDKRYICVNNTNAILEGNFLYSESGIVSRDLWSTNSGCALTNSYFVSIKKATGTVWGFNISDGIKTFPLYEEKVRLKFDNSYIWVDFILS